MNRRVDACVCVCVCVLKRMCVPLQVCVCMRVLRVLVALRGSIWGEALSGACAWLHTW